MNWRRLAARLACGLALVPLPDLPSAVAGHEPIAGPLARVAGIPYLGGPVLHSNRTHAIFWEPAGSGLTFDPGYEGLVQRFLLDVAADSHSTQNEFALTGQYSDADGPAAYASRFAGAVIDSDPLPHDGCVEPLLTGPGWTTCLTDAQLQDEITRVVAANALPVTRRDIYFLLTPRGFGDCSDGTSTSCALGGSDSGYCGYHSSTPGGILYAVIPYNAVPGHCQSANPRPNASPADPAISTVSHEQAEVVTDPLGDGWIDSQGSEIADVCITAYGSALGGSGAGRWDEAIGGHHYWLQELFSRLEGGCRARPRPDRVWISAPPRVAAGTAVGFVAHGRQPGGRVVAYRWTFGDGRGARGRRVSHAYSRRGSMRVVVQATDAAGNWAYAARTIRVTGARSPT